jgi:hypothetical protein
VLVCLVLVGHDRIKTGFQSITARVSGKGGAA